MRIALVHDSFLPVQGGIELQMLSLAQALVASGHSVHVVTADTGAPIIEGIAVRRLGLCPVPASRCRLDPRVLVRLRDALSGVDIVHAHITRLGALPYFSMSVARALGIATVATWHSVPGVEWWFLSRLGRLLKQDRFPVVLTAVSPRVAQAISAGLGDAEVAWLPNGVRSVDWRGPLKTDRDPRCFHVVYAGRLAPNKRPVALVRVLAQIRKVLPQGMTFRATIAGTGMFSSRVESLVRRCGLGEQTTLTGWLTRVELAALYRRADVFLQCSRREAFGIAALEACHAGLPVVARGDWGPSCYIEHGRHGLLASSDSEIVENVRQLATNVELWRDIAAHNHHSPPPFDWGRVLELHERVYRLALSRRAMMRGRENVHD